MQSVVTGLQRAMIECGGAAIKDTIVSVSFSHVVCYSNGSLGN